MRVLDALIPERGGSSTARNAGFSEYLIEMQKMGFYGYSNPVTTYGSNPAEPIPDNFESFVLNGLRKDSIIGALIAIRTSVFAEARFQFQDLSNSRAGRLFGTRELALLEKPWPGGTTPNLLSRMILHADLAGNSYVARIEGELVILRPDWVEILMEPRIRLGAKVGYKKIGYVYWEGGKHSKNDPAIFLPDEVAHFSGIPDPLATYRGMSWMTPIIREIQADLAASDHKLKFFENAATPNIAVSIPKEVTPENYERFRDIMDARAKGSANAYETMYLGGGADVTVIGAHLGQIDFKVTQGAGETRMAAAAGVPAVLVGFSEGLQGSSLNAGNYQSAKRRFVDATISTMWRDVAGSLQVIIRPPNDACRLWYDARDIPFLRDDESSLADIVNKRAATIKSLVEAGYDPDSVVQAVDAEDLTLLKHSGMFSVQLQSPGSTE